MARAAARRNVPMVTVTEDIFHTPGKGFWGDNAAGLSTFFRPDLAPGSAHIETLDDGSVVLNWVCPCGCGACHFVILNPRKGGHGWQWDGNREKPTLTPSLGMHPKDGSAFDGSGYHWHGYLKAGLFEEC